MPTRKICTSLPMQSFIGRRTNCSSPTVTATTEGPGLDADAGALNRMWGAFEKKPMDLDQCPPPSLNAVPDGPGPQQFSIVHAIRVSDDGLGCGAGRENRRGAGVQD